MTWVKEGDEIKLISCDEFRSNKNKKYKSLLKGYKQVKDKDGNYRLIDSNDPRYLNGEFTDGHRLIVKDKNNNHFLVEVDDPRYISGELKHV